ncbi:MAG: hypothetical protein WCJ87_03750 [Burkholderiales bacterium]
MSDSILAIDAAATPASVGTSGTAAAAKKNKGATPAHDKAKTVAKTAKKTASTTGTKRVVSKSVASAKTPVAPPAKAAETPIGRQVKTKHKLVRDSFTMPQSDFELIDLLKQRGMNFRRAVKKGELLRAGLQVLAALPDVQLEKALSRITPLKTGRPKKAD